MMLFPAQHMTGCDSRATLTPTRGVPRLSIKVISRHRPVDTSAGGQETGAVVGATIWPLQPRKKATRARLGGAEDRR